MSVFSVAAERLAQLFLDLNELRSSVSSGWLQGGSGLVSWVVGRFQSGVVQKDYCIVGTLCYGHFNKLSDCSKKLCRFLVGKVS